MVGMSTYAGSGHGVSWPGQDGLAPGAEAMRDTSMVRRRRSSTDHREWHSDSLVRGGTNRGTDRNRSSVHTEQLCGPRAIDSRTAYPKCRKQGPEQRKVMTAVQLRTCMLSRQKRQGGEGQHLAAAAAASSEQQSSKAARSSVTQGGLASIAGR